jgi:hypothetical protein
MKTSCTEPSGRRSIAERRGEPSPQRTWCRPLEFRRHQRGGVRTVAQACVSGLQSGWVILFTSGRGRPRLARRSPGCPARWDTTCFWIKPDASPRFNGQGPARGAECFVTCWAGTGYRRWNGGGKRGIYTHCVNTGRQGEHPTEKPVPLMLELVADFTRPGESSATRSWAPGRQECGLPEVRPEVHRRRAERALVRSRLPPDRRSPPATAAVRRAASKAGSRLFAV